MVSQAPELWLAVIEDLFEVVSAEESHFSHEKIQSLSKAPLINSNNTQGLIKIEKKTKSSELLSSDVNDSGVNKDKVIDQHRSKTSNNNSYANMFVTCKWFCRLDDLNSKLKHRAVKSLHLDRKNDIIFCDWSDTVLLECLVGMV